MLQQILLSAVHQLCWSEVLTAHVLANLYVSVVAFVIVCFITIALAPERRHCVERFHNACAITTALTWRHTFATQLSG